MIRRERAATLAARLPDAHREARLKELERLARSFTVPGGWTARFDRGGAAFAQGWSDNPRHADRPNGVGRYEAAWLWARIAMTDHYPPPTTAPPDVLPNTLPPSAPAAAEGPIRMPDCLPSCSPFRGRRVRQDRRTGRRLRLPAAGTRPPRAPGRGGHAALTVRQGKVLIHPDRTPGRPARPDDPPARLWRIGTTGSDVPVFLIENADFFEPRRPGPGARHLPATLPDGRKADYPDNCARFALQPGGHRARRRRGRREPCRPRRAPPHGSDHRPGAKVLDAVLRGGGWTRVTVRLRDGRRSRRHRAAPPAIPTSR